MFDDFKAFAMKGNVMDMAVGVIMGAAFGKIVTTFTDGILMPPIGLLMGGINFTDKFFPLDGKVYDTLEAAKKAGAPIITYGALINNVIDFAIVAVVLYMLVKQVNRLKSAPPPAPPPAGPTPDQELLKEIRDILAKK